MVGPDCTKLHFTAAEGRDCRLQHVQHCSNTAARTVFRAAAPCSAPKISNFFAGFLGSSLLIYASSLNVFTELKPAFNQPLVKRKKIVKVSVTKENLKGE